MTFRPAATVVSAAAALVVIAGGPAIAAGPAARIVAVTAKSGQVELIVDAVGLATGQSVDPNNASITIDGTPVQTTALTVSDTTRKVIRTVVLAVDVSGSMAGTPLAGAKSAVHAFVSAVPADVRVGLVVFGAHARVATPPTTDRTTLLKTADALQTSGETALYDGMLLALATAGTTGSRSVVVLSDGGDTVSMHKPADVSAALSKDVLVDVVPLATSSAHAALLGGWATATGGRSITAARSSDLANAFTAAASDSSNEIDVTALVPDAVAGKTVTIGITMTSGVATLSAHTIVALPPLPPSPSSPSASAPVPTATAAATVPPAAVVQAATPSRWSSQSTLYAGLGVLFVALAIIFGVAVLTRPSNSNRVQKSLAAYSLTGRGVKREKQPTHLGETAVARSAVEFGDRVARNRGFDVSLRRKLEAAGLPLRPGEWVVIRIGIALAGAFLLFAVLGAKPVGAIVGLVAGALAPAIYVSLKQSRRRAKFGEQLASMLQLVAGSLSAGFSLPQAFDTAAREGAAPMAAELSRALVQTRLGMPLEDALEAVGERMGSKDFAWVVMAIRIQRDVGGNLAEVLNTVAETLRERDRLRRQVLTLSAEGRLSAYILFALPIFMALYMILVRPAYISVLWHEPIGYVFILVAVALQAAGAFWLKKVTTVEV